MDRAVFQHHRAWSLAILGSLIWVAACEEDLHLVNPDPAPAGIVSLVITPSVDTLYSITDTVFFVSTAFDQFGAQVGTEDVMWRSSDGNIVGVTGGGAAVSRSNGTVAITATLDAVSDSVSLTVAQRVARVEIVLSADTLRAVGETTPLAVSLYDANGYAITNVAVDWTSSDKTVAVVSENGVITAVRNGTTFIAATAEQGSDSVRVTVLQRPSRLVVSPNAAMLRSLGETLQLTAAAFDSRGNVMPVESIQWSASSTNVIAVSATGIATAVANGVGYVRAVVGESSDSVAIEVDQIAVFLDLTPDTDTLDAFGETVPLTWAAQDARVSPIDDTVPAWTLSNATVVRLDGGVVTTVGNGEVMVTARMDGAADTVNFVVNQVPVSMSIDPTSFAVAEGDTMHLAVSLRDRNDSLVVRNQVEWSVSDSNIAFVDQTGILFAFSLGAVDVTARTDGFTDGRTVTVVPLFSIFGINFSPFLDGQDPSFVVSEQQIRDRIAIIAPYTQWIRTFGCTGGLDAAGVVAREFGLQIAMGAWLGTDSVRNEAELDCLIQRANQGEVDLAIVGGEVLLRGDLTEDQLIGFIQRAQAALPGIPVTYNDTHDRLLAHPNVIAAIDVVLANFYPFWDGTAIGNAITSLDASYRILSQASGGKTVMVGETGWPTCGNTILDAQPNPANATTQRRAIVLLLWIRRSLESRKRRATGSLLGSLGLPR